MNCPLFNIQIVDNQLSEPSIIVEREVNTIMLPMELDTGASVSLISEKTFKEHFANAELAPSDIRVKTYTHVKLKVLEEMSADRGQEYRAYSNRVCPF